jgi:hypothetical protein
MIRSVDYDDISYSRMTRSMEQSLSASEFKILAVLRRLIPDGRRRKLSNAIIARHACVSEGTVSIAIRAMDGVFLVRHALGDGRGGGFAIEMLPPPELRREKVL